ncbi:MULTISPECIES: type VII secretion-associated protein [unclassified Nocardia]|uniref:type VII secretion-associated protein n=1 Tax=unclassified Nocardia TaxID=2637762 RepID=UPI001CE428ED|nr:MULTISPECIES: type VII secretion-associated protein [unclassified Nocardia]
MSTVELVVTESRIWARGSATHWDLPPSITLGGNGYDLIVGEPLTPPTQVSSAVQFATADRIALEPRLPSAVEALNAIFGTILQTMRITVPADRIIVICSTEWGPRRRGVFEAALRRFAADILFEELAIRTVDADEATSHSRRVVVFEFGSLTTTASTVVRDHRGTRIESCEHEPNLAADELSPAALSAFLDGLLGGRPADLVQVFGVLTPQQLETVRAVVHQSCGATVDLRVITGPDLLRRAPEPSNRPDPAPPTLPDTEWMQPLRARAAAMKPPNPRRPYYIAGAAIAVVVVLAATAVILLTGSHDKPGAVASNVPPTQPDLPPPPIESGPTMETFGRLQFQTPEGWKIAPGADPAKGRIDLIPQDGTKMRMTVVTAVVDLGTSYDQVATELQAKIAKRPPGTITDLTRDVVFGGRSGISYQEHPTDGSTVRWHVLVEFGYEISIGCQYADNNWSMLSGTCDKFATTVHVLP